MTYGGTPPTITPTYNGFVNGDTAASLTSAPTCSTTATGASPVSGSPYSSSCTGAVDPNYAITYVPGTVAVTPAPLTVTASSGSMTYGGTPPTVTPGYSGFKNGDRRGVAHHAAHLLHDRHEHEPAVAADVPLHVLGCHPVSTTPSAYVAGAITVNTAPLTVTASSGTMTYGGTPPTITPGLQRLRQRRHPRLARRPRPPARRRPRAPAPVAGSPYAVDLRRRRRPRLRLRYVPGAGHGHQGPADRHRLGRLHDLRRRRRRPSPRPTRASSTATPPPP